MTQTTRTRRRWPLVLGVMVVLIAGCVGFLEARSLGVFDSQITQWIKRAQSRAAKLTQNGPGIDTETTSTFVIEPRSGGGCDIGLHYSNTLVGGGRNAMIETQCAGMSSVNGELTISGCPGFYDAKLP